MIAYKIPGSRHYRGVSDGIKALGRSPEVGAACYSSAAKVASAANSAGHSTYDASERGVVAGRMNEFRAGAVVSEVEHHYLDSRDRTLLSVLERMKVR